MSRRSTRGPTGSNPACQTVSTAPPSEQPPPALSLPPQLFTADFSLAQRARTAAKPELETEPEPEPEPEPDATELAVQDISH